jgi:hypothetical protein
MGLTYYWKPLMQTLTQTLTQTEIHTISAARRLVPSAHSVTPKGDIQTHNGKLIHIPYLDWLGIHLHFRTHCPDPSEYVVKGDKVISLRTEEVYTTTHTSCTCPSFINSPASIRMCKHMTLVQMMGVKGAVTPKQWSAWTLISPTQIQTWILRKDSQWTEYKILPLSELIATRVKCARAGWGFTYRSSHSF